MFLLGGPDRRGLYGSGALATQPLRGDFVERRGTTRYGIHVRVNFQWRARGGSRHSGVGVTRDMSTEGIYVLTDTCPPLDAKLEIEVHFPPLAERRALQMRASGRVVRREFVNGGEIHRGFAAACQGLALRNKDWDLVH